MLNTELEGCLSFASHVTLVGFGFWSSPQRLPDPRSNFDYSAPCGGAGQAGESAPRLHVSAEASLS